MKTKTRALDEISFGNETIDLGAVEQLYDRSQTNAVTEALVLLRKWIAQPQWRGKSAATVLAALDAEIERKVSHSTRHVSRIACEAGRHPYLCTHLQALPAGLRCAVTLDKTRQSGTTKEARNSGSDEQAEELECRQDLRRLWLQSKRLTGWTVPSAEVRPQLTLCGK